MYTFSLAFLIYGINSVFELCYFLYFSAFSFFNWLYCKTGVTQDHRFGLSYIHRCSLVLFYGSAR